MSKIIEGLYYSESHEWARVEGDVAEIGITDYAQHELGNIVYVDMPDVDDEFEAGDEFGAVDSVKASSPLNIPVGGTVIETNDALADDPQLLNRDPYGAWIIKVRLSDAGDLTSLMDAAAYEASL